MERALIGQYKADIERLLAGLTADNYTLALEIARLPEQIRGFGHVKERHFKAAQSRREQLLAQWPHPAAVAGQRAA